MCTLPSRKTRAATALRDGASLPQLVCCIPHYVMGATSGSGAISGWAPPGTRCHPSVSALAWGAHLEAGLLELLGVPVEGRRGVGAGEDIFGHEEAPLHVLPVGALPQPGHLRNGGTQVL
eukprot:scaffold14770_cov118-Isochrysis_galbana.AAC.1